MSEEEIKAALADIRSETDPNIKHLKLAGVASSVFREQGFELVVVGGSAIEFYTEGAYTSGDLDMCLNSGKTITVRQRQQIMGTLEGIGGPRSWQVAEVYFDILGELEKDSRAPLRRIATPYGQVTLVPVEDLVVERVLISIYPHDYAPALECARKLAAAALLGEVQVDWAEVRRLAQTSAYGNWPEVKALVDEQSEILNLGSPYDSE